jgi:hypothetical protein
MINKEKIKILAFRALRWIALTALRASVVLSAYVLYLAIRACELALFLLAKLGDLIGVTIKGVGNDPEPATAQAFTEDEIEAMAKRAPSKDATIDEVKDHFGISYRQARKVKEVLSNPLSIKHFAHA